MNGRRSPGPRPLRKAPTTSLFRYRGPSRSSRPRATMASAQIRVVRRGMSIRTARASRSSAPSPSASNTPVSTVPARPGGGDRGGADPHLLLVGLDGTADQKAQVAVPGRPGRDARAETAAPVRRRRRRGTARRPGALSLLERWRRVSQTGQGRGAFPPWTAVYSAARASGSSCRASSRSTSDRPAGLGGAARDAAVEVGAVQPGAAERPDDPRPGGLHDRAEGGGHAVQGRLRARSSRRPPALGRSWA